LHVNTRVHPFFFGIPGSARFAVYHPAREGAQSGAVVLCYPIGHEYLRAHRAYRNLALSLSRSGIPVLRFDYLGSGDSAGSSDQIGVEQWNGDVDAAIDEVKRLTAAATISLVGLRFGGTLAALAAARRNDVDTLLLWDPVLSGSGYLEELQAVQRSWLLDRLGREANRILADCPELIGMPVGGELLDAVGRIDLRAPELRWSARRLVIVSSTARADCQQWQQELTSRGTQASYRHVPSAGDWVNPDSVHQLLLPHEVLKEIVTVMTS
jgi:pimeloyl-ACP methyl ester carboxylesterase